MKNNKRNIGVSRKRPSTGSAAVPAPSPVVSTCRLIVTGLSVNGRRLSEVDYARTERADGTVEETGTPPSVLPGTSPLTALADAIAAERQSPPTRRRTRGTR